MGRTLPREVTCKECGNTYTTGKSGNLTCSPCINKKYRERNKHYIEEIKRNTPCSVCGETDPVVLQFHHVDPTSKWRSGGKKKGTPSERTGVSGLMGSAVSLKRIQEEIDKCIVLCANCHLRQHAQSCL